MSNHNFLLIISQRLINISLNTEIEFDV